MLGPDFEIRPARPEADRYRDIMLACFGKAPDKRYFEWKYAENPAGEVVAFEAVAGNQIAGFYGVIPWQVTVGKRTLKVYQSMDTMTHPDFQRRGIFVKLANATYAERLARDPNHVIIGIPGSTSYPGFVQKLGWTHVLDAQYVFKPRALSRGRIPADCRVRTIERMDVALERYLARREASSPLLQTSMDPAFLDWRVFRNPAAAYDVYLVESGSEAIGLAVAGRPKDGRVLLYLADSISEDRWPRVIDSVTAHIFGTQSASVIHTWRAGDDRRASAFSRALFLRNPFRRGPFSYRVPFIVRSPLDRLDGLALRDARSFDLQPLIQD